MKNALLLSLLLFAVIPLRAQPGSMKLKPGAMKEYFDKNPALPATTEVGMVAGHAFRKMDACVPIWVEVNWKERYQVKPHTWYQVNFRQYYPGELWYRVDSEEFVIVANPANYEGKEAVVGLSGSAEQCKDARCDEWVTYGSSHCILSSHNIPGFGRLTGGAFQYTYPTVITQDEEVPVMLDIQSTAFEFKKGQDYWKPDPTVINNLNLLQLTYSELVAAAARKQKVTKTIRFDGNNDTDDEPSHKKGEVTISILFECSEKLEMVSPARGEKHVFSEANPGTVSFELQATCKNPEADKEIRWIIPEKEGCSILTEPENRMGPTIKVTYQGLPRHNRDFGPTEIKAEVDLPVCGRMEVSTSVNLFFPRNASNNPEGEPNWYYYWQQTSAGRGSRRGTDIIYHGRNELCGSNADWAGYYPIDNATHANGTDILHRGRAFIYICDFSKPEVNFEMNGQIEREMYQGIDAFGVTVTHELQHRKHFLDWWNPMGGHPERGWIDQNSNDYTEANERFDMDKDLIPDSLESGLGYDPTKFKTNPHPHPAMYDEHHKTFMHAEKTWILGSADKEDWAKPGAQWK